MYKIRVIIGHLFENVTLRELSLERQAIKGRKATANTSKSSPLLMMCTPREPFQLPTFHAESRTALIRARFLKKERVYKRNEKTN